MKPNRILTVVRRREPEPGRPFDPTPALSRESQAFLRWVAHNHGADLANRWQNHMLQEVRQHRVTAEAIANDVVSRRRQQVILPAVVTSALVTAAAFGLYALLRGIGA